VLKDSLKCPAGIDATFLSRFMRRTLLSSQLRLSLSVRHSRDPHQNGLRYRNGVCTVREDSSRQISWW